jgi:hypothetical protein
VARVLTSREQVLDELEHLASVAHAQAAEFLFIGCVLGNGAESPAGGAAAPTQVDDARELTRGIAVGEMRQLRQINRALVFGGRPACVARATHVRREGAPPIALAPLTAAQLDGLLEHELQIATAVDERYGLLGPVVNPTGDAVVEDGLRERIAPILGKPDGRATAVAALNDSLGGVATSAWQLVTNDIPAGDLDRSLLAVSDGYYVLVVSALHTGFGHDELGSDMVDTRATGAMFAWDEVHTMMAGRDLLPRFTLPSA